MCNQSQCKIFGIDGVPLILWSVGHDALSCIDSRQHDIEFGHKMAVLSSPVVSNPRRRHMQYCLCRVCTCSLQEPRGTANPSFILRQQVLVSYIVLSMFSTGGLQLCPHRCLSGCANPCTQKLVIGWLDLTMLYFSDTSVSLFMTLVCQTC